MKVLYISKASRVAAYQDKLAEMRRSVDLTLALPRKWGGQPDEPPLAGAPRTIALDAVFHGHNHFHVYRGLGTLLDEERPDLVHADEEAYSLVTAQIAALCARRRIPFLFFAAQTIDKRLPPPFGALRAAVFARAAGGIGGTERAAAVLRCSGFAGPLAVIPQMGVNPDHFRPDADARARVRARLAVGEDALVVAYVGRLIPEKGVDLLLRAAVDVKEATLLLIGSGPEERRLRRMAGELGLSGRTHFAGSVASSAIPEWMAAVDVLVLPSLTMPGWSEQFGRVLVEAMACGVPVVGSDSGEIPGVIGDAGVVVGEGDVAALSAALRRLADRPAERAQLGQRGRTRATGLFTNEIIADQTVGFYEQLLGMGVPA